MPTVPRRILRGWLTALAVLTLFPVSVQAEVRIRLSIKAILGPNGEWPSNSTANFTGNVEINLNSEQAVRDNVALMNRILARRGYAYRFFLRNDTVYTVTGQSNPYFTIPARNSSSRNSLEDAATASASAKTTFRWHDDSVNIFINDTSSGICSFADGARSTILIGAGSYETLILHEIGHYFNLRHTHNDAGNDGADDWADGDGFSETLADDQDATPAQIAAQYPAASQATLDNLIFNIMSYHIPQDLFVWQQRQEFIEVFNIERDIEASGNGFFVRSDGNDTNNGMTYAGRVRTLQRAVNLSTSSNDAIMIRGTQNVPNNTVFSKPQVWLKWRSDAVIE